MGILIIRERRKAKRERRMGLRKEKRKEKKTLRRMLIMTKSKQKEPRKRGKIKRKSLTEFQIPSLAPKLQQ